MRVALTLITALAILAIAFRGPVEAPDRALPGPLVPNGPDFVSGEILAHWQGNQPPALPDGILDVLDDGSGSGIARLEVEPGTELAQVRQLAAWPGVAWAQPDYLRHVQATVNDPRFDEQWALPRVQVPEAWDLTMGVPFVIAAVVDTGVDLQHPDLQGRLIEGYNFLEPDTPPQDDAGHGTHAAGIIAAVADNHLGVAGVSPNVMIMPLKALDSRGVGRDSVVAGAIRYAVDHGAWIINMSFTGREPSPVLEAAVGYATEKGVVVVVAAGNEGREEPTYPAAIKPAIAVGATAIDDTRPFFTNYGSWITLVAPGQSILSTFWDPNGGSIYRTATGTSSAAPLVSGVVALMFSAQPFLSVEAIVAALTSTADPLPPTGIGAGRVNALQAVIAVSPPELLIPRTPTVTATVTPTGEVTSTPTATPTGDTTPTPTATATVSATPTATETPTPSAMVPATTTATPSITPRRTVPRPR